MRVDLVGLLVVTLAGGSAVAAAPRVVADIAPVQSIVARVMAGVGAPELLLPPGASPHDLALRPSEAARLQAADLVVWTGPALTPWLAEALDALARDAARVTMSEAPGVRPLAVRGGEPFEAHEPAAHGDEEHGGDGGDAATDGHLWLDPANATALAAAVARQLGALDAANAAAYADNAAGFAAEAAALEAELAAALAPLRGRPFVVFHDAFQYFERRFAIPSAGSIALHEGAMPGAARAAAIRDRMRAGGVVCAFAEPQFEPRLLAALVEGSEVRVGTLDPLGAELEPGPELYPRLLRNLAAGLAACLAG